jgi:hypothetical protein
MKDRTLFFLVTLGLAALVIWTWKLLDFDEKPPSRCPCEEIHATRR